MKQAFRLLNTGKLVHCFATASKPSLKTQLRELYKRIHPDRFHGFPPARDANEKSFKMLQEYLAAARQGDQGFAALPYHFVFYLHQSPASAQATQPLQSSPVQPTATQQPDALPDGMHKVALTLPPPARKDYAQPDQLPAATQASLGKLLSACGLESEVDGGLGGGAATKRLRLFVPSAAEVGRQRQAAQLGPRHQLSMVRTALRLGRQVTVGLSSSLQQKPTDAQADILTRLTAALDASTDVNLSGHHIMIGEEGYGPDKQGRLWLHVDASPALWSQYLKQADLAECTRQRQLVRRVKDLEATVAQRLGVSMLYTGTQLQLQPDYMHFLQRLADAAASQGPVKDSRMQQIPLQVMSHRTAEAQQQGQHSIESNYVALSVAADVDSVYKLIQSAGPGVLSVLTKEKAAKQRLDDFRISVERRLRLRRLARDETLQDEQFVSCCKRMLYNSPSLSQIMEGLAFRISHTNQVSPEGEFIDIAWDFEV